MPRQRTGTLVAPGPDGIWKGRISKTVVLRSGGTRTTRPLYSLGTMDKSLAQRKLTRLVALIESGRDPVDAAHGASAVECVRDYADAWLGKREVQGIAKAPLERGYLRNHAFSAIGALPLGDVTPGHIRGILDDVAAKGLRRGTVEQVRGVLHRLFDDAWRAEIIESNPVARVKLPPMREVKKERVILTDEEFSRFVACSEVDLELRMLSLGRTLPSALFRDVRRARRNRSRFPRRSRRFCARGGSERASPRAAPFSPLGLASGSAKPSGRPIATPTG
jgi:hypothetical protein